MFESMETRHKSSAVTAMNMFDSGTMVVFGIYVLYISKNWWPLEIFMYCLTFICFAIIFFVLPESPKYLLINGRIEEAHESLRAIAMLNGAEYTITPDAVFIEQALAGHAPPEMKDDFNTTLTRVNDLFSNPAAALHELSNADPEE